MHVLGASEVQAAGVVPLAGVADLQALREQRTVLVVAAVKNEGHKVPRVIVVRIIVVRAQDDVDAHGHAEELKYTGDWAAPERYRPTTVVACRAAYRKRDEPVTLHVIANMGVRRLDRAFHQHR